MKKKHQDMLHKPGLRIQVGLSAGEGPGDTRISIEISSPILLGLDWHIQNCSRWISQSNGSSFGTVIPVTIPMCRFATSTGIKKVVDWYDKKMGNEGMCEVRHQKLNEWVPNMPW